MICFDFVRIREISFSAILLCMLKCFFNENNSARFDGIADVIPRRTWEDLQSLHSVVILESELWCSDLQIETRKSLKFQMVSGDLEFFTQILCVWNLVSVSLYFCMSLCLSVSCHNSLIDLEMQKFEISIVSCLKLSNQQGEGWQKNLSQKSWPIFWKMLHSGLDCICSSAIWSCFHV